MVAFIGHGLVKKYSCEFQIQGTKTVRELIDQLSIPEDLYEILLPAKGSKLISMNDSVNDNDIIHLFIELNGG